MIKRLEATVTGRVQMVMFRDFVRRAARRLDLAGSVKNETSGTVAVVAEGEEERLRELLSLVHEGPMLARVDKVDARWRTPLGLAGPFVIQY